MESREAVGEHASPTIIEVDENWHEDSPVRSHDDAEPWVSKKPVYSMHKWEDLLKSYNLKDKPAKNFESIRYQSESANNISTGVDESKTSKWSKDDSIRHPPWIINIKMKNRKAGRRS